MTHFLGPRLPNSNSTRSNFSAKMNTTLYALLSLAVATLSVGAVGETRQCTTYATIGIEGTSASSFNATYIHCNRRMLTKFLDIACEERSGLICSEGCSTFVSE
ncbi:hypothetical protein PSTT_05229 [Puccinia striiformis]|uniref:Uncharacterized protein n=1 Tax=Puccinia striiformis TaxID=27350 RepID=A0A2S4VPU4_9BASI|nr:hypothetical protein PSTT_05229 [Puccinia striiformis]